MKLTSRIRIEDGRATITLPAEVVQKLNVNDGDELYWLEGEVWSSQVIRSESTEGLIHTAAEDVLSRYHDAFRKLADS